MAVGVRLARGSGPSAIVGLETYLPEPRTPSDRPDLRHRVRWLELVPGHAQYHVVVDRIGTVADAAAGWGSASIVLEAANIGSPIRSLLRRRTSVRLCSITRPTERPRVELASSSFDVEVSEADVMDALTVVVESRRIVVAPDCPLHEELADQLGAFEYHLSERGIRYSAARGHRDELVRALALAIWWGERRSAGDNWLAATKRRLGRA